ncbi:MAG: hypothetical protein WDO70_04725 [Alphaproteobacteria bacterium]
MSRIEDFLQRVQETRPQRYEEMKAAAADVLEHALHHPAYWSYVSAVRQNAAFDQEMDAKYFDQRKEKALKKLKKRHVWSDSKGFPLASGSGKRLKARIESGDVYLPPDEWMTLEELVRKVLVQTAVEERRPYVEYVVDEALEHHPLKGAMLDSCKVASGYKPLVREAVMDELLSSARRTMEPPAPDRPELSGGQAAAKDCSLA